MRELERRINLCISGVKGLRVMKKIFKKQTYMQPNQKRSRQHLRLYVIEKIFSKIITDYKPFDLEHRELHFQTGWKQQK